MIPPQILVRWNHRLDLVDEGEGGISRKRLRVNLRHHCAQQSDAKVSAEMAAKTPFYSNIIGMHLLHLTY